MKLKNLITVSFFVFLFILFFANVKEVGESIVYSLNFCASALICSVFPYMVLSSFVVNSTIVERVISGVNNKHFNKLGVCKTYAPSVLLGSVSGFVTGAKCICEIYDKEGSDKTSFSNAVILSSNAGVGFVVSCVGIRIWNSIIFGIVLYLAQIILSVILGKLILKRTNENISYTYNKKSNYISSFTGAVTSSAYSVLSICSFVVFFSAIITALSSFAPSHLYTSVNSVLNIALEFCQGSFKCLNFSNKILCGFLSGFCIGFGGLCVHFQIFSVCENYPLDKVRFIVFKLLHGVLLGAVSALIVYLMK